MNNYNYIVSKSETDALKEMIFKRARERAVQLNQKTQASYTDSIQNDIMEIAHNSFVSTKNPFAEKTTEEEKAKQSLSYRNIGFSERKVDNIKQKLVADKKMVESAVIENNMKEAKEGLETRKSFTGALSFLNSQASISLVSKKKAGFEAIA